MTLSKPPASVRYGLVLLCFFGSISTVLAQPGTIPGNDAVVLDLIQRYIVSRIDSTTDRTSVVVADFSSENPLSQWLKTKITEACLSKDYVVYSTADSAASAPLLRVVQPALQITYQTAGRNWMFRSKEYTRRLAITMQLEIVAANGRVLLSKSVDAVYEDRISRSAMERFQKSPHSFLRGTKRDSGLIKRWLEPVATTLATATVIYLFYSLRSD